MGENLKVLLVIDSEDEALLIRQSLKQSGFAVQWQRVETAHGLDQALTEQPDWDVIISDDRLSGFNASTALEIVKRHQPNIPFIVVSGTIGEMTAIELMRAGARDYLIKDNLVRLPEAVRREIRDRQIQAERPRTALDLAATQERLQLAIEASGLGTWDWYIQTGELLVNEQYTGLLGYHPADLDPLCTRNWQTHFHPDDFSGKQRALIRYFKGQIDAYSCEFRLRHRLGHWVWILERGRIIERDALGRPLRMAGTCLDISDRKRVELHQTLRSAILERIVKLDSLSDILEVLVLVAEAQIEGAMGSIMICDIAQRLRHGASPNLPEAYSRALDGMAIGAEAGSCGTAAYYGETVIVADIATNRLWQDFKALALNHGLRSCWSTPAVGSNGQVLATCAVYFSHCRYPQPQELEILTLVADLVKIAVERHQAAVLDRRERYLTTLVKVQNALLASADKPSIYQEVLQILGPSTVADRIYIFENHTNEVGELLTSQRAKWCAPGITPPMNDLDLQNVPYEGPMHRWQQVLSRGEMIQGVLADFSQQERELLEPQGIQSILVFPLIVQDQFWGFIEVANCTAPQPWDDLAIWLLSRVAATVALAQERELVTRALTQMNRDLENRIQQRTAALQNSEAKLQAILKFAPASIYLKDLNGKYILANQALLKLLGISAKELVGKRNEELFDLKTAARLTANDQIVIAAGQVQQFEEEVHGGDQVYTMLSNKFLLFDQNQQPYALGGISTDITERKIIQETLKRKEAHLRHIATNVPGVIFQYVQNYAGQAFITYISDRCQEVFELEPGAVKANINLLSELIHPDDLHSLKSTLQRSVQQLKKWTWEGRIFTSSGQQKWIQGIAQPERITDSETLLDGLLLDITDRKSAESLLQNSNAELARATRLKDDFLATMSHELRTPLNAVLGIAEGLQQEVFGPIDNRQNKALDTIRESGQHLLELINDILDFSKVEAGKFELNIEEVSIQKLGETSLRFVQPIAFKKRIQLLFNLPRSLQRTQIFVDERRIRQALINLLINAVKFTPEGGQVELAVHLDIHQVSSPYPLAQEAHVLPALCFTVTDTGIGIAPGQIDRLFKSFIQIDSRLNRQYKGTGLGLALVKRLINLHGGNVGVSSTPGQGSCFAIRLPYTIPLSKHNNTTIQRFQQGATAIQTIPSANSADLPIAPLILLVGHDKAEIQTFASYLEAKQYRVSTASEESQLVQQIQANQPDLLLFDSETATPNENSMFCCICHDQAHPSTPVMVVTQLVTASEREKWLQAGARAHLSKPLKLKVLAATIKQLLDEINTPQ